MSSRVCCWGESFLGRFWANLRGMVEGAAEVACLAGRKEGNVLRCGLEWIGAHTLMEGLEGRALLSCEG